MRKNTEIPHASTNKALLKVLSGQTNCDRHERKIVASRQCNTGQVAVSDSEIIAYFLIYLFLF